MIERIIDERHNSTTYASLDDRQNTGIDYTEIMFWDSPVAFARKHAQRSPDRDVQEIFVADLAEKIAPRFKQGYLIEVVGLRDKEGKDISRDIPDQTYPSSVYSSEMEGRAEFRATQEEIFDFLIRAHAAHVSAKNPKLIFLC